MRSAQSMNADLCRRAGWYELHGKPRSCLVFRINYSQYVFLSHTGGVRMGRTRADSAPVSVLWLSGMAAEGC